MATPPDGTTGVVRVDVTPTDPVAPPASVPAALATAPRTAATGGPMANAHVATATDPPTVGLGGPIASVRAATRVTAPHVAGATAPMTGGATPTAHVGPRTSDRAVRATDPPTEAIVVPHLEESAARASDPVGVAASAMAIGDAGPMLAGTTAPGAGPGGTTRSAAAGRG